MRKPKFDFTPGTRYGRLTLTGESESRKTKSGTKRYEKCICDCGNVVWVVRSNLTRGNKSCGCVQREVCRDRLLSHGMTKTRIFKIFSGIKTRCYNQNSENYKNYGGRGIKCLWDSFEDFYRDMGENYMAHVNEYGEKDTTIERIDVNGNYCKDNCTRKTKKEQVNNQRVNTIVVINGEQHNLGEWSKKLGIPRETLKRHIIKGKIKGEIYRRGTGETYNYKQSMRGGKRENKSDF